MQSPQPRSDTALPVELLLSIFELLRLDDLDRSLLPDLTAIALVSRTFNDVITSVLYRTVVFPQGVDADVQCEAFYSALRGSPHLGAAVRNLIMPFSAFGIDAAYGAYQKLLPASIVALCPNLRTLEVSAARTTALFAAISISQVERLSLRNMDPRALREMQVHSYPRLRYLHLDLRGLSLSRRRDRSFQKIASQRPTPFLGLTSAVVSVVGHRHHAHVETIIRDLLSHSSVQRLVAVATGMPKAQAPAQLERLPVYSLLERIGDSRTFVCGTHLDRDCVVASRVALIDEARFNAMGTAVIASLDDLLG